MSWFELGNVPALLREALFQIYITKQEVIDMSAQLSELMERVTEIENAGDAAIALLQGLKVQLDEALASGDLEALEDLSIRIGQQTQELADAVIANTPVEPDPLDPLDPLDPELG